MRVRIALFALCAATGVAAMPAHGQRSHPTEQVEARAHQGPYLGARGGWLPSRLKSRSVLWAVGDGADGGANGRAVAAMVAANRVDRFLYLGDVYSDGTALDFANNYRPLFGGFDSIAAPTIGNHEWANRASGYDPYWQGVRGTPPPPWYSFAASGWQLLSLNSNAPSGERSAQLAWLRKQLEATPRYGSCRIGFMHHPRFSAGPHGDDVGLQPIFRALSGRARILLSGHDHAMQRLIPVRGITPLVDGAGGYQLYPVNESDPRLNFSDDTHHGALRIQLRPGRAVLSFVGSGGAVLDRSVVRCRQRS